MVALAKCQKCGGKMKSGGCWKLYLSCASCGWDPELDAETDQLPIEWTTLYTMDDVNWLKNNWKKIVKDVTQLVYMNTPPIHGTPTIIRTPKTNVVEVEDDVTWVWSSGRWQVWGPQGWEDL